MLCHVFVVCLFVCLFVADSFCLFYIYPGFSCPRWNGSDQRNSLSHGYVYALEIEENRRKTLFVNERLMPSFSKGLDIICFKRIAMNIIQ
jgi:hypothetical protein